MGNENYYDLDKAIPPKIIVTGIKYVGLPGGGTQTLILHQEGSGGQVGTSYRKHDTPGLGVKDLSWHDTVSPARLPALGPAHQRNGLEGAPSGAAALR